MDGARLAALNRLCLLVVPPSQSYSQTAFSPAQRRVFSLVAPRWLQNAETPPSLALFARSDAVTRSFFADFPVGGSGAIVDALVRGLEKNGGTLRLGTHVEQASKQKKPGLVRGLSLYLPSRGLSLSLVLAEQMTIGWICRWFSHVLRARVRRLLSTGAQTCRAVPLKPNPPD